MSFHVSTTLCAVLEGVGGDRSSGVATLGGDLKSNLGGGDLLRRRLGLMGDATLNFSKAGLSAGRGR